MQKVVGVKFNSPSKIYTFLTNGISLHIGDAVITDTKLGLSYGTVATEEREIDETSLSEPLKSIVRMATAGDKKKHEELVKRAEKDIIFAKQQVEKRELDMKIVSAEYTHDASKIVIEFASDDRVDFRELLKDLASEFRVRIELHQVGQRDEVKLKGGLGPCGEICCCARFLKDFEHVTVKMAKNQGLSLSPTKISGLCGRLMCCLAYENGVYEQVLKKMPKIGSQIDSPKGSGVVIFNDILRERVSVKVHLNDDSYMVYDFALEELDGGKLGDSKFDGGKSDKESSDTYENNANENVKDYESKKSGDESQDIRQDENRTPKAVNLQSSKQERQNNHKNYANSTVSRNNREDYDIRQDKVQNSNPVNNSKPLNPKNEHKNDPKDKFRGNKDNKPYHKNYKKINKIKVQGEK